jgi:hypothetical protein
VPASAVEAWLESMGASAIEHPGGTLLAHLGRTAAVLESWGARPALIQAGAAHAVYGTDGFPVSLVDLSSRDAVVALVGAEAEAIVWTYGSADRSFLHPQLDVDQGPPVHRSRFDGRERSLSAGETGDYLLLTLANELDVARHSPTMAARLWPWLRHVAGVHAPRLPAAAIEELSV